MYMYDKNKYRISLFGVFIDKSMEEEFLTDSLSVSSKITSSIALVIGLIMMLFLVHGYIVDDRTPTFINIILIRLLIIIISAIILLLRRN